MEGQHPRPHHRDNMQRQQTPSGQHGTVAPPGAGFVAPQPFGNQRQQQNPFVYPGNMLNIAPPSENTQQQNPFVHGSMNSVAPQLSQSQQSYYNHLIQSPFYPSYHQGLQSAHMGYPLVYTYPNLCQLPFFPSNQVIYPQGYQQPFGPGHELPGQPENQPNQPRDQPQCRIQSISAIRISEGNAGTQNEPCNQQQLDPHAYQSDQMRHELPCPQRSDSVLPENESIQPRDQSLSGVLASEDDAGIKNETIVPPASTLRLSSTVDSHVASNASPKFCSQLRLQLPKVSQVPYATNPQMKQVQCSSSLASTGIDTQNPNASSDSHTSKVVQPKLPSADDSVKEDPTSRACSSKQNTEVKPQILKGSLCVEQQKSSLPMAKAISKLFEGSLNPSDLTMDQYAASNGPFIGFYRLFTSKLVLLAERKGQKIFLKGVDYIVRAYKAKKCWGGDFKAEHLMVGRDGSFYIAIEPNAAWTRFNFLDDLKQLVTLMMKHFRHKTCKVPIYFEHLSHICKSPPPSIILCDVQFKNFVDFVRHHICFGHPMNRADFVTGAGQWLKSCSTPDVEVICDCLKVAFMNSHNFDHDWRDDLDTYLNEVLWDDIPPSLRETRWPRLTSFPQDEFIFCRHAFVHLIEKTFHTESVVDSASQVQNEI